MKRYNPSEIEPKWQKFWQEQGTYAAQDTSKKQKYYALSFFPYPSGAGLHIGHVRNFTITDVAARFKRMTGHQVMQPMGWDSFGLPAENYAIKTGVAPQVITKQNTDNFRKQAKNLGFSIDWNREFGSSDPDYYKWTQWFFLLLHKRGLAYRKESLQFWCETDKTVLANEQVEAGRCWRCGNEVTKKSLNQWFFKITDYADRLEADLEDLDWPHGIKTMQRNWIGRSKGAEVTFRLDGGKDKLTVFTTRPDTLFGVTFLVVAPEHPLAKKITTPGQKQAVEDYIRAAEARTDIDRMDLSREKTGVFTGSYAINPVNGAKIPIWTADYVLAGYGTGAIMAVPAHDERDHAFAKKFNLPILEVIEPETGEVLPDEEPRRSIIAIVRNPKTNQFLTLNWGPKYGGTLFIGGGQEENETARQTAEREILEETGYKNVKFVAQTGTMHHHYYAFSKNVARNIEVRGVLFDLADEEKAATNLMQDEKGMFKLEWLSQSEVETKFDDESHINAFKMLVKGERYRGEGIMANSGPYNGKQSAAMREQIVADLAAQGTGKEKTTYKIRDWLISRQRYWGAPIPMVHCPNDGIVPVPEDQLPVVLPPLEDYHPTGDGRSPLAKVRDWVEVDCPKCGGPAERETDTMDGFACSSWYALRFADPHNNQEPFSKELVEHWAPVDLYVGGAEHAVMHLLYARMWTKVMFDAGITSFDEPFKALRNQGMLLADDGTKFSKSKGNGVDPDDIIKSGYGADALRSVILFLAPFDQKTPWSPGALGGMYRFLNRIWTLAQEVDAVKDGKNIGDDTAVKRVMHRTIKRVTEDMHRFGYNTAISAVMEAVNDLYKLRDAQQIAQNIATWRWTAKTLAQLVAPFAPHIAEEVWHQFDGEGSVHLSDWPKWDDGLLVNETMTIVVQVNGKVRARLQVAADTSQQQIEAQAKADEHVVTFIGDKTPKTIYIPGRLINFVV
jgi:leucyl-tRNA synthetase